jgi:molybdopterin-guanine dinucleotide biosynthesis protein A
MTKKSLIIPMAGIGSRFKKSGYKVYKPFIKISGKRIIDGVLEPFKDLDDIFILTTQSIYQENIADIKNLPRNVRLIFVDDHKLGPAYTIYLAINQLPIDREYFIAYCDVWWVPGINFKIEQFSDAIVFVHKGFHPHLVEDNFSAFCKEDPNSKNKLLEIREKESYTSDWMNEPVSVGVFYVKNCKLLFSAITKLINDDTKVAGEYYPSMLFNLLIKEKISIDLLEVESYAHIGVPSQLIDLEAWSNLFNNCKELAINEVKKPWINCMLMGGTGSRMKKISNNPKYLMPVDGRPMFITVLEKLNCYKEIVIASPDFNYPIIKNGENVCINLKDNTSSHFETLVRSLDYLPDDHNILISSCDCYGTIDKITIEKLIDDENPDCIIFTIEPSLLHNKIKYAHTSVLLDSINVIDVDIKSKANNYSKKLAGFFWFKNKLVIKKQIKLMGLEQHENEILVDHIILSMCKNIKKPVAYSLRDYIHLGTPNEYLEFQYWNGRGYKLIKH